MLVKMVHGATPEQIEAVEKKLHDLGYKTGKMSGEEITLIGAYGDITQLPQEELREMGGVETLQALRLINPDVPVVLSSGFAENNSTRGTTDAGGASFIQKPYSVSDLIDKVSEAVAKTTSRSLAADE